jgi:hypothetical protein
VLSSCDQILANKKGGYFLLLFPGKYCPILACQSKFCTCLFCFLSPEEEEWLSPSKGNGLVKEEKRQLEVEDREKSCRGSWLRESIGERHSGENILKHRCFSDVSLGWISQNEITCLNGLDIFKAQSAFKRSHTI